MPPFSQILFLRDLLLEMPTKLAQLKISYHSKAKKDKLKTLALERLNKKMN
jgi:hypothetical protein